MYTREDAARAADKARRELTVVVALGTLGAALAATGLILRSYALTVVGLIAPVMLAYAWGSLRYMPWRRYARFVSDVLAGLSHREQGYFAAIDEAPRASEDGVEIRDVTVFGDADMTEERLFYWDDARAFPTLTRGQPVAITAYGRYITALTAPN